jgi:hypothetical protein
VNYLVGHFVSLASHVFIQRVTQSSMPLDVSSLQCIACRHLNAGSYTGSLIARYFRIESSVLGHQSPQNSPLFTPSHSLRNEGSEFNGFVYSFTFSSYVSQCSLTTKRQIIEHYMHLIYNYNKRSYEIQNFWDCFNHNTRILKQRQSWRH